MLLVLAHNMPSSARTLSVTSLWLLVPAVTATQRWALVTFVVVVTGVSVAAWARLDVRGDRSWVSVDKAFAGTLFAWLVASTRSASWTVSCLSAYACSVACIRHYGHASLEALVAHLVFRYVGFWWTWVAVGQEPTARDGVVLTALYLVSCTTVHASTRMKLGDWATACTLLVFLLALAHPHFRVDGKCQGLYADGAPRWRAQWALYAQLGIFPWLALHAWRRPTREYARIFVHLFVAWVLADVALVRLSLMMAVHHAVVVVGSWLAMALHSTHDAAMLFVAAVTCLELGSATTNVMGLHNTTTTRLVVLLGITISNAVAAMLAFAWLWKVQPSFAARVGVVGLMTLLLAGREREALLVWMTGR